MADRPILFAAPMVRALLDGRKTQTRRIVKPQPAVHANGAWAWEGRHGGFVGAMGTHVEEGFPQTAAHWMPIQPGDLLWVRETWQGLSHGDFQPTKCSQCEVRYAATDPCADLSAEARGYPWRPSIFMPRWASRLTLTITDVRVERLQDISERGAQNDCTAEGVFHCGLKVPSYEEWHGDGFHSSEKHMFRTLWNSINCPGSWEANPWVGAYTFTVHRENIDRIARAAA